MRSDTSRALCLFLLLAGLLAGCIRIDPLNGYSFTAPKPPSLTSTSGGQAFTRVDDNGPGDLRIVGYRLDDSTSVSTSNNGDGKLGPGEEARITLVVYNGGTKTIEDASITPSVSGDLVTVSTSYSYQSEISVSKLGKGDTRELSTTLKLVAAAKAPDSYAFTLKLSLLNYGDLNNYSRTFSLAFTLAASGEALTVAGYSLTGGNGDASLSPGESASLFFRVKNAGSVTSRGVSLKATLSDAYVTLASYPTTYSVGDLSAGSEASTSTGIQVSVSQLAPKDHTANLALVVSNGAGHEWTQTYSITLAPDGAVLTSDSYTVSGGNGDQTINRGENVYLSFRIKNTGTVLAKGVSVTADVSDPYIAFSNSYQTSQYGDITPGSSSTSGSSFLLVVGSSVTSGHQFPVTLTIKDNLGSEWKVTLWLTAV